VSLAGAPSKTPQVVTGPSVTVQALVTTPEPGELIEVTRTQPKCAPITKQVRVAISCDRFRLTRPKVIAIATDSVLKPVKTFTDSALLGGTTLDFGQDITFEGGPSGTPARALPHGPSQGTTTAALEPKMRKLLGIFAANDHNGKAKRLFDAFLAPNRTLKTWSDVFLTADAKTHGNIVAWVELALNAPTSSKYNPAKTRIHQALKNAGWDIDAAVAPKDLGVPAFNLGSRAPIQTQDWDNGLAVMINGVQHVIVVAKEYRYDVCRQEYFIKLEYVLYDVFGLDDEDIKTYGADGGIYDSDAAQGITAWWQLQHQHGYVPLITRISFEREFTVPAR
jgi:hypothetical protein